MTRATVESVLIDIGESNLSSSAYGKNIVTLINAQLASGSVSLKTTGSECLRQLYHSDDVSASNLLQKELRTPRDKDSYRTFILGTGLLLLIIVGGLTVSILLSPGNASDSGTVILMGKIVDGLFNLLGQLLGLNSS